MFLPLAQGICICVGHSFLWNTVGSTSLMRQSSYRRFLKKNEKKLVRTFNFTFRYIDNVLSLNNSRFGDFVERIYPIKLWNIVSTERYILHMQVILECCTYMESSKWENWNLLFCRKVSFLAALLWYPLFQV
jgi:hypothetical protein